MIKLTATDEVGNVFTTGYFRYLLDDFTLGSDDDIDDEPNNYDPDLSYGENSKEWWVEFNGDARVVILEKETGESYTLKKYWWGQFSSEDTDIGHLAEGTRIRLIATSIDGKVKRTNYFEYLTGSIELE